MHFLGTEVCFLKYMKFNSVSCDSNTTTILCRFSVGSRILLSRKQILRKTKYISNFTYLDSLVKTFVCNLDQLFTFFVNITNKKCLIQVAMETIMVHCDVNCRKQLRCKLNLRTYQNVTTVNTDQLLLRFCTV